MPARSEIDDKFKWAVNDLYSSDEVMKHGRRIITVYLK